MSISQHSDRRCNEGNLRGESMLNITVQTAGMITILRCQGRIVAGDESRILREAVLSCPVGTSLIIDLHAVGAIDAAGLGLLPELREWTRLNGIPLKFVNLAKRVRQMLELTHLSQLLEAGFFEETNGRSHVTAGNAA
jgi:anti-anti-sigma factor